MRTILVGTDLTERSDPAIFRGAALARTNGARLVVCHVGPRVMDVNPLFPQQHQQDLASLADREKLIADAVSRRVVQVTGLDLFDVVVDEGEPPRVLCQQAIRLSADLVVVMSDRPGTERSVTRDLAASPCSVLVLDGSVGSTVALLTWESEVDSVHELAAAARSVLVEPAGKFVVIMWADLTQERRGPLLAQLSAQGEKFGAPVEPWFADMSEMSLLARVASDPDVGLVVLQAPRPDKIVDGTTSPLDDALATATSSLLLIRS
jgi:nucleotide-binding universal stress UspA family protein